MSKIYEALLRAEMDRLTAGRRDGESLQVETASPAEPYPVLPHHPRQDAGWGRDVVAPASVAAPYVSAVEFAEEPPPAPMQEMQAPGAAPLLDLAAVRTVTWKPSLKQLPSLLERGAPVEQFRGLRSRLHEFRDLNMLKTLLISSGLPEEGKSYIAANIAVSFARHKTSRVLLIDGDMRRGSLHKLLGTSSEPGLTEYLSGKASLQEVMQIPRAAPGATLEKGLGFAHFYSLRGGRGKRLGPFGQ